MSERTDSFKYSQNREERDISRRKFLGNISVLSLMTLTASNLLMACAKGQTVPTATPPVLPSENKAVASPPATNSMTVLDALKNRKSINAFKTEPLPEVKLLELLWAAWGINRPDSGKRTAPTAMNAQEIDIYVLLSNGVFVYDAKQNRLVAVLAQDLRPKNVFQGFMKDAPVHLLFVADYAKYRSMPQSQKEIYSSCHTGFIGQNVYLYCVSQGLGAHFYAGLDRKALKDSLKLRNDQEVIFGQAVGYPSE